MLNYIPSSLLQLLYGTWNCFDILCRWVVQIEGDPRPTSVDWYAPSGKAIPADADDPYRSGDYSVRNVLDHPNMHTRLTIRRVDLDTAGAYRLVVRTDVQAGAGGEEGGESVNLRAEETLRLTVKAPAKVPNQQLTLNKLPTEL